MKGTGMNHERALFVAVLTVVVVGLAYVIALGLLHR
jgi:hypothetical protein